MASGFFKDFKKGMDQGASDIADGTYKQEKEEKRILKEEKQQEKDKVNAANAVSEVEDLLGSSEEVLYAHSFLINKMIVTNRKLIYIDNNIAKNKTYAMIPFNKITSYSLLKPTGLSAKGKLMIFTGGDTPSLQLESMMDAGMKEFCKILADKI